MLPTISCGRYWLCSMRVAYLTIKRSKIDRPTKKFEIPAKTYKKLVCFLISLHSLNTRNSSPKNRAI
jgi:hypothetical protein